MNVEIITIGDELLIGQVIDSNSSWMGEELNSSGFNISRKTTISDSAAEIKGAMSESLKRVDIVLITGGLGPTRDDITKRSLAEFFNAELIYDENVFSSIKTFLKERVQNINEISREQAMVPDNCKVIENRVGTAPIMWFDIDDKVVVSMPGVPLEMKTAMTNHVIPLLSKRFDTIKIIHETLLVSGISEPVLAERLEEFEDKLPEEISLAYLPSPGRVRLRLSGKSSSDLNLDKDIKRYADELKSIIGEKVWGSNSDLPEVLIGSILKESGQTLACAESCTGGNIAHLITTIPGSSAYFMGGVVAYDNSIKENVLKVSGKDIEKHGAVSREVVEQMASGVKKIMGVDWAVATSGIAGPGGGSIEKPVGTVWIAWAGPDGVDSQKYNFGKDRGPNIIRSTEIALVELLCRLRSLNS